MKKVLICLTVLALSCFSVYALNGGKEKAMIEKNVYGKLKDGTEIYIYTLKNDKGAEAKIINYGATVVSLTAPDRNGKYSDIVLGWENLQGYVNGSTYFGAIVGRYGNRIAKGKFTLDGKTYQLSVNDGVNTLHGGKIGFDKRVWKSEEVKSKLGSAVKFTYVSPDGEEGFPSTLTLSVTYTLTNSNELRLDYKATTDKTTILNPTHHSYFNLSGDFSKPILDHILQINSDEFTPVDKGLIPTGVFEKVEGTPMDFRKPTAIGARINDNFEQLKIAGGYDHNFVLKNYNGKVREVADVYEPTTGRYMEVFTDQPGIQFYSGNFLNGTQIGKDSIAYPHRAGFCLETQHYPDSPNEPKWPSVVLKPGQTFHSTTIYKFSAK